MRTETKAFSGTKGWLWDIFSCGLPVDYDLEALRRLFLLNLIILVGGFFLALLGTIAFIQRDYILGAVDFSLILFLIWLFSFLRNTRRHIFVGIFGTIVTGIFYFFLIAYGGIDNTAYVWAFTYPLVSLFLLGAKLGSLMSLLLLLMASTVFILGGKVSFFASYTTELIIRFIPAYITVHLIALSMEKLREIVQNRLKTSNSELERVVGELEERDKEKEVLIHDLQETMREVRILQGILPICVNCKKIHNDAGYWEQVEKYIQDRSEAQFSHGICPECAQQLYPEFAIDKIDRD
jgi:hypothetical protein